MDTDQVTKDCDVDEHFGCRKAGGLGVVQYFSMNDIIFHRLELL